ncbi:MAG: tRNA (guanosine(46)-N7)-methyltransferase TrmB [Pseudomonadales bacterium]
MAEHLSQNRRVKSFVLRQGRLTKGQQAALDQLLPHYSLDADRRLDPKEIFGNDNPVRLEIGFGMGDSLAAQAAQQPDTNYIGIEVHRPGLGRLLMQLDESELNNVRVICDDCIPALRQALPDNSLSCIQVFFPDPWPKKRHHKRRLINAEFLALIKGPLKPGGILHVATDWLPYAEQIEALASADAAFQRIEAPARPGTKFEARGLQRGHEVTDLAYELV